MKRDKKPMKCIVILSFTAMAAIGQTTARIAGAVLDAKTQKPIPAALVMAVQSGAPPLVKNTKSGGDGAFQIQSLAAGKYSLCVQADGYLDPCQWNGSPTTVTLVAGQLAAGVSLRVTPASLLNIQVQDAQNIISQTTKDGRHPEITVGVWGPRGLYYPARASGNLWAAGNLQGGIVYQIPIPRDTVLNFYIASRDLKLGDTAGTTLPGNTSQQAFQHGTGDLNPKSCAFTVLGLLP